MSTQSKVAIDDRDGALLYHHPNKIPDVFDITHIEFEEAQDRGLAACTTCYNDINKILKQP